MGRKDSNHTETSFYQREKKMKRQTIPLIAIMQLVINISLFGLSFYIFAKSFTSTIILLILEAVFPISWSKHMMFIILSILIIIAFLFDVEGGGWQMGSTISWSIFIPCLLGYSNMDFSAILGFPLNFKVLKPDASFLFVLVTGILLAAGDLLSFNNISLQWVKSRLTARGASKKDIDFVIGKSFLYLSGLTLLSAALTLCSSVSALLLTETIPSVQSERSLLFTLLPVFASAIISITLLIYLRGGAKLRQKEDLSGGTSER